MRTLIPILMLAITGSALSISSTAAQSTPQTSQVGSGTNPASIQSPAESVAAAPSDLLKPALNDLSQTMNGLKLEKWKGGSVRSEAAANTASIQKDLQGGLANLLADADAAPDSLGKLLAVSRNVDALYDVLLRVVDGARVAGSGDQVAQLQQTMASLEKARQSLNTRIEETAEIREKQIADLRVALKNQPVPVCQAAAPVPAPAPATAKKRSAVKKKPKPPAAAAPATPAPAAKPS